jgi:hypothetical protein
MPSNISAVVKVLGLSGNGLDKRDAKQAAKIRQIAAHLGADRAESKIKFLRKAELLETGGLPLLVTCLCTTNITALDLSANAIKGDGNDVGLVAIVDALADTISGMRAMSSVNLLKNDIDTDQAKALVLVLKEHPTLKSLCGNKGDKTEFDMSGKMKGAGDAIMLATEIIDNGAMTSLNLASNSLGIEGAKIIAAILPKCT